MTQLLFLLLGITFLEIYPYKSQIYACTMMINAVYSKKERKRKRKKERKKKKEKEGRKEGKKERKEGGREGGKEGRKERKKGRKKGASLVVQRIRIRLPMQGTQVRALLRDDPTWL